MVVAPGSISQVVFQRDMSRNNGNKWQCFTTHCPIRQHTYPQRNFEADKVTPPLKDKGWGRTQGRDAVQRAKL